MQDRLIGQNIFNLSFLHSSDYLRKPAGVSTDRFIDSVPEEFLCGVCQQVVRDPIECANCGVLYCLSCRGLCLHFFTFYPVNRDMNCPGCKGISFLRQPSKVLRKIIGSLHVRCKNSACPVIIELDSLKSHQKECDYKQVTCKRRACRVKGLKKDFLKAGGAGEAFFTCSRRCLQLTEFENCLDLKNKFSVLKMYQTAIVNLMPNNR